MDLQVDGQGIKHTSSMELGINTLTSSRQKTTEEQKASNPEILSMSVKY